MWKAVQNPSEDCNLTARKLPMVLCAAENCTDYNQIFFFVYFSINKIKTNFMTVKFCLMKNQDYSNSYKEKIFGINFWKSANKQETRTNEILLYHISTKRKPYQMEDFEKVFLLQKKLWLMFEELSTTLKKTLM